MHDCSCICRLGVRWKKGGEKTLIIFLRYHLTMMKIYLTKSRNAYNLSKVLPPGSPSTAAGHAKQDRPQVPAPLTAGCPAHRCTPRPTSFSSCAALSSRGNSDIGQLKVWLHSSADPAYYGEKLAACTAERASRSHCKYVQRCDVGQTG